jgi:hypothetical protein
VQERQHFLHDAYSHTSKQRLFASHADMPFTSKPLLNILQSGELETIKQKATYVGMPRKGGNVDFEKRLCSPLRTSKRRAQDYITMVNDFFVVLAVGTRKGAYSLDIPEIDNWLAEPDSERHFLELWPEMRPSTKRHLAQMRKYKDEER